MRTSPAVLRQAQRLLQREREALQADRAYLRRRLKELLTDGTRLSRKLRALLERQLDSLK
jgi:hypothetical protein